MTALKCAKAPCKSCPYRRDVPSGVWAAEEYDKLPGYDGEIIDQLSAGARGLFMCHQQDGRLCAGWIGTHGAGNLAAVRMATEPLDLSVFEYESPVPLFATGAEASAHGKRAIRKPEGDAQRVIARLVRQRARRG